MADGKSGMPAIVPAIVFSLLIGGAGGYWVRGSVPSGTPAAPAAGGGGTMGSGGMGGMMGGGPGGGGGGQQSSSRTLTSLVRNLGTIQKVQNKGLTPDQSKAVLAVLKEIKAADKLPAKDCDAKLAAIQKVLTEDQKTVLADMTPQRGGRGGGMGAAMMGGGPGGAGAPRMGSGGGPGAATAGGPPPGSGGGPMMGSGGPMMGGMGGQPDPERPFASERSKKALDDLIALLGGK